jgi:hypothetical protein
MKNFIVPIICAVLMILLGLTMHFIKVPMWIEEFEGFIWCVAGVVFLWTLINGIILWKQGK